MEFVLGLILFLIGGAIVWGVIWFIGEVFRFDSPPTKQTPVDSDPNWEDHIRHDPYHPAGYPDEDEDYDYYEHR